MLPLHRIPTAPPSPPHTLPHPTHPLLTAAGHAAPQPPCPTTAPLIWLPASWPSLPSQMLGKLRVRLSCVRPGQPISAELPLLSERARGAQRVGALSLSLQVTIRCTHHCHCLRCSFSLSLSYLQTPPLRELLHALRPALPLSPQALRLPFPAHVLPCAPPTLMRPPPTLWGALPILGVLPILGLFPVPPLGARTLPQPRPPQPPSHPPPADTRPLAWDHPRTDT